MFALMMVHWFGGLAALSGAVKVCTAISLVAVSSSSSSSSVILIVLDL